VLARPEPLRQAIAEAIPERPFEVRWWDGAVLPATAASDDGRVNGNGSSAGPTGPTGPVFTVRSPEAVAHALRAPGQLGIGRAYVSGALDVDDVEAALSLLDGWSPPAVDRRHRLRLMAAAARAVGLTRPPAAPASELRPRGRRHSVARDARAVRHHYDVSNDFFALFLDASMTYSCAFFSRAPAGSTLEEAQQVKLGLTADKLELEPGQRVLDVGCGWGSFTRHVAREHGASVLGVTLSERQAELARRRADEEGLGDRIDIRVMDWRELRGERFDAIASIGMVEHVGSANIDAYAARLGELLAPGGRLLNHGIARLRHTDGEAGPFSERFVFPDAAPLHVSRILTAVERAGLEPEHVEGYRDDYAETLRHWAARLDEHAAEGERLAGPERMRVWGLYLRAARRGFETGFTSIFQVKARKPA
jgi:cyclopropane-fatty-acyl-phospholipid synthase